MHNVNTTLHILTSIYYLFCVVRVHTLKHAWYVIQGKLDILIPMRIDIMNRIYIANHFNITAYSHQHTAHLLC